MKPLLHLRFLRPLASLFFVTTHTSIAWFIVRHVFRADAATAAFSTFAVTLPLMVGITLAGAAQEPLHRPFSLVVPNLGRRQRIAAASAWIVATVGLTLLAAWMLPNLSSAGASGLICALVALPLLDLHVAKLGWITLSHGIWMILSASVGAQVAAAVAAHPWLFLPGGLAVGIFSLVRGFSRASLRIRAHIGFVPHQARLFPTNVSEMARRRADLRQPVNPVERGAPPTGRDWAVRTVGPATGDWLRVFWHANFGGRKRSSYFSVQLSFVFATVFYAVMVAAFAQWGNHQGYWVNLAALAAPKIADGMPLAMLYPGMVVFCGSMIPPLRIVYPLSRVRLARIEFCQAAGQLATALVLITASVLLVSWIGQVASGRFLPGYGAPALLAGGLQIAVLLPVFSVIRKFRRPGARIAAGVFVVGAMMLVPFTSAQWSDRLLAPGSLGWLLTAAALSQWILWLHLHRYYRTTDLYTRTDYPSPLAPGLIGST